MNPITVTLKLVQPTLIRSVLLRAGEAGQSPEEYLQQHAERGFASLFVSSEYATPDEAAAWLGVSRLTIFRMIAKREITDVSYLNSRVVRIPLRSLLAILPPRRPLTELEFNSLELMSQNRLPSRAETVRVRRPPAVTQACRHSSGLKMAERFKTFPVDSGPKAMQGPGLPLRYLLGNY